MGPEATVLLMSRVIAVTPARDDADHVPLLVDQNPQVPSRIAALIEGDGDDPAPVLARMARGLAAAGVAALAMPCNTAHHYAGAIRAAAPDTPFLDMPALAAEALARRAGAGARIGMLASPAVARIGLYEKAFAPHGLQALWAEDQEAQLDAIRRLKRDGADPVAIASLRRAADQLAAAGAAAICVACTEFSLAVDRLPDRLPVIDALDALAVAIRDASFGPAFQEDP